MYNIKIAAQAGKTFKLGKKEYKVGDPIEYNPNKLSHRRMRVTKFIVDLEPEKYILICNAPSLLIEEKTYRLGDEIPKGIDNIQILIKRGRVKIVPLELIEEKNVEVIEEPIVEEVAVIVEDELKSDTLEKIAIELEIELKDLKAKIKPEFARLPNQKKKLKTEEKALINKCLNK